MPRLHRIFIHTLRGWGASLAVAVLLAAVLACPATARAVDASRATDGPLTLVAQVDLLEDPTGHLTLNDVRAPVHAQRFAPGPAAADAFNFGITASAYWFRLTLSNPQTTPLERLLELGYARLSHVTLYHDAPDGQPTTVVTGATQPFESRPYAHRFFVFPLTLAPQSTQTLYLRVQSTTAFIVPLQLWAPAAFHAHERKDYAAQAWYFGMASAMVLFNLLLLAWLRDRVYFDYAGFTLTMALTLAAQNGLVKEFARLSDPLWSDLISSFGYSWTIAAALQFVRQMLDTRTTQANWDRWLRWLVLFFVLSPLVFLFTGQTFIKAAAVTYLGAVLVAVVVGLRGVWQRQRSAYFFVGAFTLLATGAVINALRAMGWVPTNVLTTHAMQIGSALEMVLLAFALADRFNQMRREKAAIQKKLLIAQQTLIDSLRQSEQALEQRVDERTSELQALNRKLAALSMTDGLTGIANRRHFDDTLAAEWQRAQRTGQRLGLGMVDVDWFKRYNDHYGHLMGDDCLRRLAQALGTSVNRPGDLVARYGGEEFVILAPNTDSAGLAEIAQRLQNALSQQALAHDTSPYGRVTVSIGLASMAPSAAYTPQVLIERADAALYRAKSQGRNRVHEYSSNDSNTAPFDADSGAISI